MSKTIEAELHEALLDIAPNAFTKEDQAILIAEASEIFRSKEKRMAQRKAGKGSYREALTTDSLLEAMRLSEMNDDDEFIKSAIYIDSNSHDPSQVMRKIESRNKKYSANNFGNMDIINDDDIDKLLHPHYDEKTVNNYSIDDGHDRHDPELYEVPDTGKHRSDSIAR